MYQTELLDDDLERFSRSFPLHVDTILALSGTGKWIYLTHLKDYTVTLTRNLISRFRMLTSVNWVRLPTSQRILKSFCSTRSSSQYSRVTTVECRGLSFSMDSPNAVPIPSVHNVIESCNNRHSRQYLCTVYDLGA